MAFSSNHVLFYFTPANTLSGNNGFLSVKVKRAGLRFSNLKMFSFCILGGKWKALLMERGTFHFILMSKSSSKVENPISFYPKKIQHLFCVEAS